MRHPTTLIVFGGLPGTGKTTIARTLATRCLAAYLRIDVIEQALRSAQGITGDVGPTGYFVANTLAEVNLANGLSVVADCVNPVEASRQGWRSVAIRARTPIIQVEVICSNPEEHRRRIEQRYSDIEGLALPTWRDVQAWNYAPWPDAHIVIDSAHLSPGHAVTRIERWLTSEAPVSETPV